MKLEERYIRFLNNVTTTTLDEQMAKIKVVNLEKLYNFVVEHFLIWINFDNEKYIWISQI
jgi:hypothetical protein